MENFGMYTKIVGVARKNEDGTDRQDLISSLEEGDQLTFKRDYANDHDENAIAVYDWHDQQLGYLKASVAEDVAPILDSGGKMTGFVTEVTGGIGGESYGFNIRIEVFPQKDYCISDAHSNDAISSDDSVPTDYSPLNSQSFVQPGLSDRIYNAIPKVLFVVILFVFIGIIIFAVVDSKQKSSNKSTISTTIPYTASYTTTTTTIDTSNIKSAIKIKSCKTGNPNTAGGVDLYIAWQNTSKKDIKYITFTVVPYNAVDDIVECDVRDIASFRGKITGPIKAGATTEGNGTYWDCAWYNNTIVRAEIVSAEIEYMDGTTLEIPEKYIDLVK